MLLSKNRSDLNYGARIKQATKKVINKGKTVRLPSNFAEFLLFEL